MRVAVICAVCNEEKNLPRLIAALKRQTRKPDEIFFVDDGSADGTLHLLRVYADQDPSIRIETQANRGPAAARNLAWRLTQAEICVFTDGDCVPDNDWLETVIRGFDSPKVGAVAGTYRTLNTTSILARFIGLEIAWRYRHVRGEVDVHGSYNLAVRRHVLEEVGGYNEIYRVPSGEDWDLTYKISRFYKIIFIPEAVVGHSHPEKLLPYLKLQVRRGFDRIKLYNDHPDKRDYDTYTGPWVKYQVLAACATMVSLPLTVFVPHFFSKWLFLMLYLLATSFIPFGYFFARDPSAALYSIPVQMMRYFAWASGAMLGLVKFGWSAHFMRGRTQKQSWERFWERPASRQFSKKSWSKIRMMALLDGFLRPGMKVLDAGCGSGFFSAYFADRGCEVYSLDYSEQALEMAREVSRNRSKAYLHENLLHPDCGAKYAGMFDLIFSDGMLEHFSPDDQRRIFENLKKMKAQQGLLATFVPNLFSWWQIVRPWVMPSIHEEPFVMKRLAALHDGMEILASGGLNVLPFRYSPERLLAGRLGMILYCVAR